MRLPYQVSGRTINEAWFNTILATRGHGRVYTIDKGEYEGQKRKELFIAIEVSEPSIRPLACSLPGIYPTTDAGIEEYFHTYLMSLEREPNETYRYGHWIAPAWEHCCELLAKGRGGCNQATISLGAGPGELNDFEGKPPCLRLIDMRLEDGKLGFVVYFRSWDLVAGLPENLGGLQLLKEHCGAWISELTGERIEDGPLIAISKGAHIYDHFWPLFDNRGKEE